MRNSSARGRVRVAWLVAIAIVAAGIAWYALDDDEVSRERELDRAWEARHRPLVRALRAARRGQLQLDLETVPVVHTLHVARFEREVRVPEGGVLDTGTAIDPRLGELFRGTVRFDVTVEVDGVEETVLRRVVPIARGDAVPAGWRHDAADLSHLAGRRAVLRFDKGFTAEPGFEVPVLYDLLPTDFMYWRKPVVRSRRLPGRPPVIVVSLDTVRADHLGFMGYERATSPALDALAARATVFTTAISHAPWTTPSHFSLFTSTHPRVHGGDQPVSDTTRRWNAELPTMASLFAEAGYLTGAFTGSGSISAQFGLNAGFEFYDETEALDSADAETVFGKAIDWLEQNHDRTFLLFVHTYEPHAPYLDERFASEQGIDHSDERALRTALYDGDIRRTDDLLAGLLEAIERLGLDEEAVLVVTSDHGEDLGGRLPPRPGHGHSLYDELLHVPLVIRCPGLLPAGARVGAQVRLIDVLPTVIECAGLTPIDGFEGRSLVGLAAGIDREPRPAASEATTYGPERESLRFGGFKYISRISYGQLWHSNSRGMDLTPRYELYDLERDPGERDNLAAELPDKVAEMERRLRDILQAKSAAGERETGGEAVELDPALLDRLRGLGYID